MRLARLMSGCESALPATALVSRDDAPWKPERPAVDDAQEHTAFRPVGSGAILRPWPSGRVGPQPGPIQAAVILSFPRPEKVRRKPARAIEVARRTFGVHVADRLPPDRHAEPLPGPGPSPALQVRAERRNGHRDPRSPSHTAPYRTTVRVPRTPQLKALVPMPFNYAAVISTVAGPG